MYDLETSDKDWAVPHFSFIYKPRKIFSKYYRDISEKEYQKSLNNCIVFEGTNCINEMLDHVLGQKGEREKVNFKIFENNLFLIAHNGPVFGSYIVLKKLHQWQSVVNSLKNGAGIASLKIFEDYADQIKKIPQYVQFRCGKLHIRSS